MGEPCRRTSVASRLALLVASLGAMACHETAELEPQPATPAELRARAEEWHDAVDLYKPVVGEDSIVDPYQAPMFYRERPSAEASLHAEQEFGALSLEGGELTLDVQHPTVYTLQSTIERNGSANAQTTFVWFRKASSEPGVALQGLRVTHDQQGYPAVLEVLEDSSGRSLFYVSKALEEDAVAANGEPLPGNLYSVEPATLQGDDLLVVHLLGQGSEPLGPILYEAFASADILDVHCRCASSRIKTIGASVEYELRSLTSLSPGVLEALKWTPQDGAPGFPPADTPFLRLRLPPIF